jgi:hypothetical protein
VCDVMTRPALRISAGQQRTGQTARVPDPLRRKASRSRRSRWATTASRSVPQGDFSVELIEDNECHSVLAVTASEAR